MRADEATSSSLRPGYLLRGRGLRLGEFPTSFALGAAVLVMFGGKRGPASGGSWLPGVAAVGALAIAAGFLILSFYSVIGGWAIAYLVDIFHMPQVRARMKRYFNVKLLTGDVTGIFAMMKEGRAPGPLAATPAPRQRRMPSSPDRNSKTVRRPSPNGSRPAEVRGWFRAAGR